MMKRFWNGTIYVTISFSKYLLYKNIYDKYNYFSRIRSWKTDNSLDQKEVELLRSNICSSCGHNGKVQKHAKSGCVDCGTVIKCNNSYG